MTNGMSPRHFRQLLPWDKPEFVTHFTPCCVTQVGTNVSDIHQASLPLFRPALMLSSSATSPRSSRPDDGLAPQPDAFALLLKGTSVVAGLTHLAFLSLFLWADVPALAAVNVGSVLCYVWMFMLATRGAIERAYALAVLEVLGHAILAVTVIGWESGFHYYILLVIPVAVISSIRPASLKAVMVMAVMMTYLILDIALRHRQPASALPEGVVDGLHYFNVVGAMVILIFLASYYYHLINRATASLKDMALTDSLTRLHNRRALVEVIRREESRHGRHQHPLSFVLMDLDHFKSVNDTLGHDTGDLVLQAVGEALRQGTRDVDFVGRWGGEEFLAVLPDTTVDGAALVAERLRSRIADLSVPGPRGPLNISVTIGVSQLQAKEPAEHAISRADVALYEGKRQGRNRVCHATPHLG